MNRLRTITALAASAFLMVGGVQTAYAQGSGGAEGGARAVAGQGVRVYVNTRPVDGDLAPSSIRGALYVPLRFMTEYLGGAADWDNARQQATLTRGTRTLILTANSTRATLNGEGRALRYPALVVKGRVLLPVQEVARLFEARTVYNPDSRVLFITTPGGSLEPASRRITRNTQRSTPAGQGVGANGRPLRGNGKGQTTNTARQGTASVVTRPNGKGGRATGVAPSVTPKTKPVAGTGEAGNNNPNTTNGTTNGTAPAGTAPAGSGSSGAGTSGSGSSGNGTGNGNGSSGTTP